ncbi:hypothetical protein N7451_012284 [Penicillium sp. IBT 35674x]|nr:hypothetical protein N7451_012284 [Penicillium sp. IBT 35674x]
MLARLGVFDQAEGLYFEGDTQSLCSREPDDALERPGLLHCRSSSLRDISVREHMPTVSPAGEPMYAGSDIGVQYQPDNGGLIPTPLSMMGAVSPSMSPDARQHQQQQWVGADMDTLLYDSNIIMSADQSPSALESLFTAPSSSYSPISLPNGSLASLTELGISPASSLNLGLAGSEALPEFWKVHAV